MLPLPQTNSTTLTQIGLGITITATAYGLGNLHLRSLFSYFFLSPSHNDGGWQLDFTPSEICWADRVFFLMSGVLNKGVRSIFGGTGVKVKAGEEKVDLPRLEVRCPVIVAQKHESLYDKAIFVEQSRNAKKDDGKKKQNGMGEGFLLASLTNQLMLLLVVHPALPISPLGAVNVRNRIEVHNPYQPDQVLAAHAVVGGAETGRITKRGIEFDIHITVTSPSSQTLILRQIITILAPCKVPSRSHKTDTKAEQTGEQEKDFDSIAEIHFPATAPWSWCNVCGDYNPIHVSSLLARLFGFKGKIAHGNHVVANFLSLLPSASNSTVKAGGGGGGWWVEMQFRRPMVLPLRLIAQTVPMQEATQEWRCIGVKDSKPYVTGAVGSL